MSKSNCLGDTVADALQADAVAVSGTTPIGPFVTPCINYDELSYQIVTTGTVTATILIEGSNDYVPALGAPGQSGSAGHWSDITAKFKGADDNGPVDPAGSPTSQIVAADKLPTWCRITVTPASGSGTVTIARGAKGTR